MRRATGVSSRPRASNRPAAARDVRVLVDGRRRSQRATASRVRSSVVGPSPPVRDESGRPSPRRGSSAPRIAGSVSRTVSLRTSSTPDAASRSPSHAALVSTICPMQDLVADREQDGGHGRAGRGLASSRWNTRSGTSQAPPRARLQPAASRRHSASVSRSASESEPSVAGHARRASRTSSGRAAAGRRPQMPRRPPRSRTRRRRGRRRARRRPSRSA